MEEATLLTGKVPYGEDSRKYRRTTYTHRDWFKHRSTDRLFGNLASTVSSGVVRNLLTEVSAVAAVATALVAWNCVLADGWTDLGGVVHEPLLGTWVCLSLPALPFTLSASSLGLLLVFRTNASYARWLEARVTWGRIVAHSRGIIRQASVWNTADAGARGGELRQLCHSVYAFPRCLCAYLRGAEDEPLLVTELRRRNCPALEELIDSPADARPVLALHQLTQTMHAQTIDEKRRVEMDKSVVLMMDACEACERLFSSPVPLVYTRHTARFLSSYLLLLPLALWPQFADSWNHIATIPTSAVLATFLFGIDELAVQLEEPFSILPLEALCARIDEVNSVMARAGEARGTAGEDLVTRG